LIRALSWLRGSLIAILFAGRRSSSSIKSGNKINRRIKSSLKMWGESPQQQAAAAFQKQRHQSIKATALKPKFNFLLIVSLLCFYSSFTTYIWLNIHCIFLFAAFSLYYLFIMPKCGDHLCCWQDLPLDNRHACAHCDIELHGPCVVFSKKTASSIRIFVTNATN
jgi:hypothetical protein